LARWLIGLAALLLCLAGAAGPAGAALSEHELAALIRPPLQLGTHDAALPVWTLLDGGGAMVGYVFESRDLAPLPGFSGTPLNLLVMIDTAGTFVEVRVLDQNEPVFVDGLGPGPLYEFVRQYAGKSIATNIKVAAPNDAVRPGGPNTIIDGISKATVSAHIVNETVLAAALKVARERMAGTVPRAASRPRPDLRRPLDWEGLERAGLRGHLRLRNRDVEAAFADTPLAHADPEAAADPDGLFVELWVVDVGVPSAARAVLTPEGERQVAQRVGAHEEPVLVLARGRASILGDQFVRNAVPDLLSARQGGFPLALRDADVEVDPRPGLPAFDEALVLRIDTRRGFDPATPWSLALRVMRSDGTHAFARRAAHDFALEYAPPALWFEAPPAAGADGPPWLAAWTTRAGEIAALLGLLGMLTVILARPGWLVANRRRLLWGRRAGLGGALVLVGFWGQGQLSIVNLLAIETAVLSGGGLGLFLYDPVIVLVGLFTLATLALWGRGAFCGWLCPFGVLQDLAAWGAARLGWRPRPLPALWSHRLSAVKYAALAVLLTAAPLAPPLADRMVEIEPFKTAVTLGFQRSWPFVVFAALAIAGSALAYRGYCRFVCPLGAALALLTRLRPRRWIARRAECGQPCQRCARRCRFDAIAADGRIRYGACFQCLECVQIHHDPTACVALMRAARLGAARPGGHG